MQLSTTVLYSIVLALAGNALAAPINATATEDISSSEESGVVGTSQGVEFPFSDDAIIEAVSLGSDIAPIVLDDAVYFINTTIVDEEYSKLTKRDAEAWQWRKWANGQPMYKREAAPEAEAEAQPEAEAWQWRKWANGQPMYKREAEPEAEAEAWQWRKWANGQPMYKREAEPEAEAWQWRKWANGQPMY